MKNKAFLQATGLIGFCLLAGFFVAFAQDSVEGWNIIANSSGQVTGMEYENPSTYLKIQKYIQVTLDNQGKPSGGSVKFQNGFERDMPKQEAAWYWENFNGQHALWSYLYTKGKLIELSSPTAPIPESYYGKFTRVVSINNSEYFGKLQKVTNESDVFELVIEGASGGPLHFERKVVKLLQQIK